MAKKKQDEKEDIVISVSDNIVNLINKDFGDGTIISYDNDKAPSMVMPRFSSGSMILDKMLGGGWAIGRIHEILGMESSGKTLMCTLSMICYQKSNPDKIVAIIDSEQAYNMEFAINMGLDKKRFLISQPSSGELAFDIIEKLIESGKVGLIIVDSVSALVPKAELEGDMGDNRVGSQARLMSKGLRKITGLVNEYKSTVIFINQYREKIGVMYGDSRVATGGNALKFFSSIRLDISRKEILKKDDMPYGQTIRIKAIKNKTFFPYLSCEVDVLYGKGFDEFNEILVMGEEKGIITKGGSWFWYGETRLANGKDAMIKMLDDNPELVDELKRKIL